NTSVATLDLVTSASGAVVVSELGGINLTNLQTDDGAIVLSAGGAVSGRERKCVVEGDSNDITLTTTAGTMVLGSVTAGSSGDVSLTSAGSISQPSGLVTADVLTVRAAGSVTLNTSVATLDLVTSASGAVVVSELDGINLTNLQTADGDIVLSAGGAVSGQAQVGGAWTMRLVEGQGSGDLDINGNVSWAQIGQNLSGVLNVTGNIEAAHVDGDLSGM